MASLPDEPRLCAGSGMPDAVGVTGGAECFAPRARCHNRGDA